MASARIYVVSNSATGAQRLVEAPHPAQALRHVTSQDYAVRAASARVVADLMNQGVKLEQLDADTMPASEE